MARDEQVGMGGVLAAALVGCLTCLVLFFLMGGDLRRMVDGGDTYQERAAAQQAKLRSPGYYSEYDFEAYYAEKEAEAAAEVDEPVVVKKSKRGKRHNPLIPDLPEGLKLGTTRLKTVDGRDSKIEIIDIGGSMEPVDVYAETGAAVARAAPGSIPARTRYWPMDNRIHDAARTVPQSLSTYKDVAGYIGRREPNDVQRVKAIHDYLTLKLQYDYDSLQPGRRKSQRPKDVFDSGLAVCEGYARLFKAMADELGLEAVYVTGLTRQWMNNRVGQQLHAWNAVKVEGSWYLVDATWGDGGAYSTDYLFVPGEVLSATHLPHQSRWQLRKKPISKSQFYRGAHLKPAFHAEGLDLISPRDGEVDTMGDVTIEIENPARRYLHASIRPRNKGGTGQRCEVDGSTRLTIKCPTTKGKQTVVMFAGSSRRAVKFVGALHVNRR